MCRQSWLRDPHQLPEQLPFSDVQSPGDIIIRCGPFFRHIRSHLSFPGHTSYNHAEDALGNQLVAGGVRIDRIRSCGLAEQSDSRLRPPRSG
jgi:hypothetical protein